MLVSRLRRGRAPGQYAQGGVYLRRGGSLTGGSAGSGQRAVWAATAARGSAAAAAADGRHEPSAGAAAAGVGGGGGGGVAAALSGGTPSGPLRSKFAVLQRLPAGYEDAAALLSSPSPSLRSAASATAAAPAPKPLRADILGVRQPQRGNAMSLYHRRALRQQAFLAGVPPSPCSPRRPLPHYRTGHSVWGAKKPRKAQSTASQYARKK